VTVKTLAILFPLTALLAGCKTSPSPSTHQPERATPAMQTVAVAAPTSRPAAAEPVAAQFASPATATPLHLTEIEPAVLDLAARADRGDTAYFAAHMGQAGDHLVQLMIEKVKASDLPKTYRGHLIGDRLNYHEKTHVQIELAQQDGKWVVGRLWFCR
jgi:hypothetical protein